MQSTRTRTTTITTRGRRKRRNRARRKRGAISSALCSVPKLSACAELYLKALSDPFFFQDTNFQQLPCVPCAPARRTLKSLVFAKGSFTTSTATGVGWIMLSAKRPGNDYAPTIGPIVWNTTASTWATFPNGPPNPAEVNIGSWNSPYSSSDFGPGLGNLRYRCVGMGVRIKYIGTELERGGNITTLNHPDGYPLAGMNDSDMLRFDQAKQYSVTRKWTKVVWTPVIDDECEFEYSDAIPAYDDPASGFSLGIFIRAPSATASAYAFECVAVYEYLGMSARGATYNPLDTVGVDAVRAAVSDKTPVSSFTELKNRAMGYLASASDAAAPIIGPAVSLAGQVAQRKLMDAAYNQATRLLTYTPSFEQGATITEISEETPDVAPLKHRRERLRLKGLLHEEM